MEMKHLFAALLLSGCMTIDINPEERAIDSVVRIESNGFGSGVAIKPDTILTASHVVQGDSSILTRSGSKHTVKKVYDSPDLDLAVLKVDPPLRTVSTLRCDRAKRSEQVAVVGFPLGTMWAIHRGYIASDVPDKRFESRKYMILDVGINSGNSGGPVFDKNWQVVGIVSAVLTQVVGFSPSMSNSGLAIPGNVICDAINEDD